MDGGWIGLYTIISITAMAENIKNGVVDYKGEVFNYPGLFISDGSILPVATFCGLHFTIATLSDYISCGIVAREKV